MCDGSNRTLAGHAYPIWDVAFSPDGSLLASASGHWKNLRTTGGPGEAKLWEVSSGKALQIWETPFCLYSVSFSGDGRRFAASGGAYHDAYQSTKRGQIFVWDVATGQAVFSNTTLPSCVYSVALSPDGKRLVAAVGPYEANKPFDVKLWDVDAGREVFTLGRHEKKVEAVAFSPDGKRIASASIDHIIKIWSID